MHIDQIEAMIRRRGVVALIRHATGTGSNPPTFDCSIHVAVRGFRAAELLGGIQQGDREARFTSVALAAARWPGPDFRDPVRNDKLILDGHAAAQIISVDRRPVTGGVLYIAQIRSPQ